MLSKRELKPNIPPNCLQIFSELVEECCCFEANERPTFQQICNKLKNNFDQKVWENSSPNNSNQRANSNQPSNKEEYNKMVTQPSNKEEYNKMINQPSNKEEFNK